MPNQQSGVPIGTVIAYASSTVPAGWLECNGNAVSRTTYSSLFAVVGVSWGAGDASTTFNLPDLRGNFLRGWDHGAGNDPDAASRTAKFTSGSTGNNVGSYQQDAFQGHWHEQWVSADYVRTGTSSGTGNGGNSILAASSSSGYAIKDPISDGSNGTPLTTKETRPKNAYVNFLIKVQ